MRDAFGGIVNITIIVVFLVIVSGYLAFNVNYTKAFRVKNKIISTFEQYEGNCQNDNGACDLEIQKYMTDIGYSVPDSFSLTDYTCRKGYCFKEVSAIDNEPNGDADIVQENGDKVYYQIVTVIYIDIPIINRIMPHLKLFQVSGTTRAIEPTR